jgi:hypothetical protein
VRLDVRQSARRHIVAGVLRRIDSTRLLESWVNLDQTSFDDFPALQSWLVTICDTIKERVTVHHAASALTVIFLTEQAPFSDPFQWLQNLNNDVISELETEFQHRYRDRLERDLRPFVTDLVDIVNKGNVDASVRFSIFERAFKEIDPHEHLLACSINKLIERAHDTDQIVTDLIDQLCADFTGKFWLNDDAVDALIEYIAGENQLDISRSCILLQRMLPDQPVPHNRDRFQSCLATAFADIVAEHVEAMSRRAMIPFIRDLAQELYSLGLTSNYVRMGLAARLEQLTGFGYQHDHDTTTEPAAPAAAVIPNVEFDKWKTVLCNDVAEKTRIRFLAQIRSGSNSVDYDDLIPDRLDWTVPNSNTFFLLQDGSSLMIEQRLAQLYVEQLVRDLTPHLNRVFNHIPSDFPVPGQILNDAARDLCDDIVWDLSIAGRQQIDAEIQRHLATRTPHVFRKHLVALIDRVLSMIDNETDRCRAAADLPLEHLLPKTDVFKSIAYGNYIGYTTFLLYRQGSNNVVLIVRDRIFMLFCNRTDCDPSSWLNAPDSSCFFKEDGDRQDPSSYYRAILPFSSRHL